MLSMKCWTQRPWSFTKEQKCIFIKKSVIQLECVLKKRTNQHFVSQNTILVLPSALLQPREHPFQNRFPIWIWIAVFYHQNDTKVKFFVFFMQMVYIDRTVLYIDRTVYIDFFSKKWDQAWFRDCNQIFLLITAWKVSKYGFFLVHRVFLYPDWIWRFTE